MLAGVTVTSVSTWLSVSVAEEGFERVCAIVKRNQVAIAAGTLESTAFGAHLRAGEPARFAEFPFGVGIGERVVTVATDDLD